MKNPQKYGIHTNFDSKVLTEFMKTENSCIEMARSKQHLALHPFHLNDLNSSIKEILNQGLPKYNRELDGILFGYQNITLLKDVGAIFNDACFVHMDIEADFFIFKPTVGELLQGIVNKKSKDHLGCLIHQTFNVSIPKPEDDEEWIGYSVKIGSEITLRVIYTCYDGRLPYIRGEIESVISEPEGLSEDNSSKKKKNKIIKFDEEPDDGEGEAEAEDEVPKKKIRRLKFDEEIDESPKKKKSKKSKLEEDEVESPMKKKNIKVDQLENDDDYENPTKKKKRKRARSDDESEADVSIIKKKKKRKDSA